jgi:predicted trehalose synthase
MKPKSDEERVQGIRDWALRLRVEAPSVHREITWLCDEVARLQKARKNLIDLTQEQARQLREAKPNG